MEERMKKHRQVSPERAKVWTEKSKHHIRKVPVVYYLCRNRQLEHPHFMEVTLSSSDHLYLRDVIERLNVMRGRGIASMYSWSCKRSYKNGYVWHDLSDDDIIHPAHGTEYILKGSELFQELNSGRFLQTQEALPKPPSSRNKDESSSSSSSSSTLHDRAAKSFADASTQTEETDDIVIENGVHTCTRGVSTDDGSSEPNRNLESQITQNPEICSGRTDTLESLVIADIRKLKSFRMLEEDGFRIPSSTKIKVANVIMQLVSCGSVSVKDNGFGLIPSYRSRFSNTRLRSPLMLGEVDRTAEDRCPAGVASEDRKLFTESLAKTRMIKDDVSTLKRSSCNGDSCRIDKENVIT